VLLLIFQSLSLEELEGPHDIFTALHVSLALNLNCSFAEAEKCSSLSFEAKAPKTSN
jgi:hypothetical protein